MTAPIIIRLLMELKYMDSLFKGDCRLLQVKPVTPAAHSFYGL